MNAEPHSTAAGRIADGFAGAVGRTPLVRLRRASEATGCEILGKAEFMNPGGSVKDRAALGIIEDAERRGALVPGEPGTVVEGTAGNTGMLLTVAFDYGARQELIDAVRRTRAEGREVTADAIGEHLYLPELPPVDVLVRTSGERRVSNFLLWQSAGAAIHFTDKTWPEFDAAELDAALALVS